MMHEWPEKVAPVTGMAPGELRLLRKVAGQSLEDLESEDQVKATVFIALFRMFRDEDPGVLWDKAEWTQIEPDLNALGVSPPQLPRGAA